MINKPKHGESILDATGLKCPIPVLRARKALRDIPQGGVLRVYATDAGAINDFQAYCEATGNELMEWSEEAGFYEFLIRRTA